MPSPTARQLQSPSWNLKQIIGVSQGSPRASAVGLSPDPQPGLKPSPPPQCCAPVLPTPTSTSSGASWLVGPAGTCPAWPPSLSLLPPALQSPLPPCLLLHPPAHPAPAPQGPGPLLTSPRNGTSPAPLLPSPSCHHLPPPPQPGVPQLSPHPEHPTLPALCLSRRAGTSTGPSACSPHSPTPYLSLMGSQGAMATGAPGPCHGDRGAAGPLVVPPAALAVSRVPPACETSASSVRSERGGPTPSSCCCHAPWGWSPWDPHTTHPRVWAQGSLARWFWSLEWVMWWHGDPPG